MQEVPQGFVLFELFIISVLTKPVEDLTPQEVADKPEGWAAIRRNLNRLEKWVGHKKPYEAQYRQSAKSCPWEE